VAICIVVPLIEAFDSWDNAPQQGNDIEGNLVVAALCLGLAYAVARTIDLARVRPLSTDRGSHLSLQPSVQFPSCDLALPLPAASPPLTALRI